MPEISKTAPDIQKLIDKVMPQLQSFVAGGRGSGDKNEKMNYQIAILRDALAEYKGADKDNLLSQSVHGSNLTGGLFSFLEENAGLKLSTTLGEAIRRYDDIVLENKPAKAFRTFLFADDLGKPLTHSTSKRIRTREEVAADTDWGSIDANLKSRGTLADFERRPKPSEAKARAEALHKELKEDDAATKIQAAFRSYVARKDKDPASLVDSASEISSPVSIADARAALPKVNKEATMAMLAGFKPTAEMVSDHKTAKAALSHLKTIKEPSEEEFSQKNPMHSNAARTTPVRRSEGHLSKTEAAKMKIMDAYKAHIRPDKPATTKPLEKDEARTIQVGSKEHNKLAISALKLKARIAGRKGPEADALRAAVERTIEENTAKRVVKPNTGGLRKTGVDLRK